MSHKEGHKVFTSNIPLPMCIIDHQGKVSSASLCIDDVFLYDGIEGADIFALTGIKYEQFIVSAKEETPLAISRNDKIFKIVSAAIEDEKNESLSLYFLDITNEEKIKNKYLEEKACIAIVNVDNYDELINSTSEDKQAFFMTTIDREIRNWGAQMKASITKYKEHLFFLVIEKKALEEQEQNKFSLLDEVRKIETEADFPVTLSIGIGAGGETPGDTDQFAAAALDVALGRGGDQAVVKKGNKLSYYGGKTQSVEKSNKGRSRIIGHALQGLIKTASNVLIMGHKNPDMDAFGSAIGIYALAKPINKETYIVVEEHSEALEIMYDVVKEEGHHEIIGNKKALSTVDENTLLVVVDTHRISITECPELLEKAGKIVVIDHHRKAEKAIENLTLAYTESYASSTAELVTEILQYTMERKEIKKIEADALLAGITLDTNRFSVKTGVRTFEAASWLKRAGADSANVKKFFQTSRESFKIRANCIVAAEVEDGIAFSRCEGKIADVQIINSQVADDLLTMRGVMASFVVGQNDKGKTIINARSIGNFNVQIIMEEFGGGGHLNTAGAQVNIEPEQVIEEIKKILEKN